MATEGPSAFFAARGANERDLARLPRLPETLFLPLRIAGRDPETEDASILGVFGCETDSIDNVGRRWSILSVL